MTADFKTDWKAIYKAGFDARDAAACCDVIELGLREAGDEFSDWLASHAAPALFGYCIDRALNDETPYLDSFAMPIAERLAEVFRDCDHSLEEYLRMPWSWLLRYGSPEEWESKIAETANVIRNFPQNKTPKPTERKN